MYKNYFKMALTSLALFFVDKANAQALETVPAVDLQKYMGKWYDIASFPQWFQRDCNCTTAYYELTNKNYVRVTNSCRKGGAKGYIKTAEGKAFVVDKSNNAKLKVQFFWPFKGDYWIIDLAPDYSYAVVGHPNRKYLWILGRTPEMDPQLYEEIVKRAENKGFDTSKLLRTNQKCEKKNQMQ